MGARSFLDTSVLVYTDDDSNPGKKARALELYRECREQRSGVVSLQVLQEYFVTTTGKLGVAAIQARRKTALFARLDLVIPAIDDVLAAIDLHRLHTLSFWDALIVQAALISRCAVLYSEDMQDGWLVDGLRIVNPFSES